LSNSLVTYYPGNSIIHKLDPRVKIIFMVLASVVIFGVQNLALCAFVLLTMCALWVVARLPFSLLASFGKALFPIMIFLFVVQAIFYPGTTYVIKPLIPTFVPLIGGIGYVSVEGMLFAVLLALRLLAMIILLPLVSFTTPVQNLALGLAKMGMPYQWAYATTTALNLVPILQTETGVIMDAQRLRAMQSFEKGSLMDKLRAYPALVTPLIIGSMRRAQLMSIAMDSRAFGASKERTYLEDVDMHPSDWAFLVISIIYTVAILVIAALI
jgi:energy-coupling factor transport system permease protein